MTSFSLLAKRALSVAVLGCGAALLTACGTSAVPGSSGATVTVTATPSAGQPTSAAPPSSPAPPAGPQPCSTSALQAKAGVSQGTAGSVYQVIDFTNISAITCTLYGYPGVSFAGGSPVAQIGLAATEDPATPRVLITLAPGAVASALLQIVDAENFPAARCELVTSTYLQIYPPNQTTPILMSYSTQACAKPVHTLTVDTVKAGSGG